MSFKNNIISKTLLYIFSGVTETITVGLRLYSFADSKHGWNQGQQECMNQGMKMVEIRCVEEDNMVDDFLTSKKNSDVTGCHNKIISIS